MSPRPPLSKTDRFVEVLALMTLTLFLFQPGELVIGLATVPLLLQGTSIVLLCLGLFFPPRWKASWFAILAAGLASILFQPHGLPGLLLVLFACVLCFDSGWTGRRTVQAFITLAVLVLSAEAGSLIFDPGRPLTDLALRILTDGLLAALVVTFRQELFPKP